MSRLLENRATTTSFSQMLGYQFTDETLLQQALTHRSAQKPHNERLEFLGDAILGMIIATALFQRHPTATEGELSYTRAALVCENKLSELAKKFQLAKYIKVGPGERNNKLAERSALLADTLEAVIGAIYLDGGWAHCKACVLNWYTGQLECIIDFVSAKDPKTALQEYLQARHRPVPKYALLNQAGALHHPTFTVACVLPSFGEEPSHQYTGLGRNRRQAEQQAAEKALAALQQDDNDDFNTIPDPLMSE